MAGLFREIWEGTVEKPFRGDEWSRRHLAGMRDYSNRVAIVGGAHVINLTEIGADPIVLIDNTAYPIPVATHNDTPVAMVLRKLQTERSIITDDILHGISYDVIGVRAEQHSEKLMETCFALSNYMFAPQQHAAKTPLVLTSGATGNTIGNPAHKAITMQDIVNAKYALDNIRAPKLGRRMVLSSDHLSQLLQTSESFKNQYNIDTSNGRIPRIWGFDIYEELDTAVYLGTTDDRASMQRSAYGAAVTSNDRSASFFYVASNAMYAMTNSKMYHSKAEDDPATQENQINFRKYFLSMPVTARAYGAIVSN